MTDMTKIMNCRLCGSDEMIKHSCYRTAQICTISNPDKVNLGILGDMEKFVNIKMNDDGYFINTEVRIGKDHMSNIDIPIKYCPFCGRELV